MRLEDHSDKILEIIENYSIPCRPEVLDAINQELSKSSPNKDRLAKLVASDVSTAAAIFQLCNEPRVNKTLTSDGAFTSPIKAVQALSLEKITKIIETVEKREKITHHGELHFYRFWDGALDRAIIASHLAKRLVCADPDEAYTVGLFRDSGIAILLQLLPNKYRTLLGKYEDNGKQTPLAEMENSEFGINHQILGYSLGKKWHLPDLICRAILTYNDVEERIVHRSTSTSKKILLITLVWLADLISDRFRSFEHMHSKRVVNEWPQFSETVTENVELPASDLIQILDDTLEQMDSLLQEFQEFQ